MVDTLFQVILFTSLCYFSHSDYYTILGVKRDATEHEIKKNFRRLALELHPDKIPQNSSDHEKEEYLKRFLFVQEAYEVLMDREKRTKYDLSEDGVDYEIVHEAEVDRYASRPFSTFIRTKYFKAHFTCTFNAPNIPDLIVNIQVPVINVYTGTSLNHTFYRRRVCPACDGTGAHLGSCRTCTLCQGTGIANHIFISENKYFEQMTSTRCGRCNGKGCIPADNKCDKCHGSGAIMEPENITIALAPGFPNGQQTILNNQGHEFIDRRRGRVIIQVWHLLPFGWSIDVSNILNLKYTLYIPIHDFLQGFEKTVDCPSGDRIEVF